MFCYIFIDREAREIMHLVASVRRSVCVRSHGWNFIYRPRSEGNNALGSVRLSVRPSVRLFVCDLMAAAKSNKSHYQSKVFVCVFVIRGRIAQTRSIGVLIVEYFWHTAMTALLTVVALLHTEITLLYIVAALLKTVVTLNSLSRPCYRSLIMAWGSAN